MSAGSVSRAQIIEAGRSIRALDEHARGFVGAPNGYLVYGIREAIRFLGERKRQMKDALAAEQAKHTQETKA